MTASRLDLARPAVRPALKGRILLAGPSGAGKTRTGLIIATVLAADADGSIVVIDTEKESALTYADDFTFKHLRWLPPYDPRELAEVLVEAGQQYAVTLVDSLSHFWRKAGGTLDIAEGKFSGWKAARPAQEDLVDAVLDSKGHVILCCRSVEEHVQEVENGRHVVRKLGLAPQQDSTLMYEVNVGLEIDMEHRLTVSKSRTTAVPVGKFYHPGHAGDFAEVYRDWLKGGEPPAPRAVVEDLERRIAGMPDTIRKPCKEDFFARHGRPDQLRESAVAEAQALVAGYEAQAEGAGEDAAPADVAEETLAEEAVPVEDAAPPARPPRTFGIREVAQKARHVFRDAYDAAPKGDKTRTLDRLRHAVIYAETGGAHRALTEIEGRGDVLVAVWNRLEDINAGRITYDHDDTGVEFTSTTESGAVVSVLWEDLEAEGAAS